MFVHWLNFSFDATAFGYFSCQLIWCLSHVHDFQAQTFNFCLSRYPYGQSGAVPAVCYLNLLLANNEPACVYVWLQEGLPVQHGIFYPLCASHLHVQECAVGHGDVSPHRLCLRYLTNSPIHTHLPLSPRKRGRHLHWIFSLTLSDWI